jgi:hypothetical protein
MCVLGGCAWRGKHTLVPTLALPAGHVVDASGTAQGNYRLRERRLQVSGVHAPGRLLTNETIKSTFVVSSKWVPPSSDRGLEAMAKGMNVALAVDASVWFVILCGIAVIITTVSRRRESSMHTANY